MLKMYNLYGLYLIWQFTSLYSNQGWFIIELEGDPGLEIWQTPYEELSLQFQNTFIIVLPHIVRFQLRDQIRSYETHMNTLVKSNTSYLHHIQNSTKHTVYLCYTCVSQALEFSASSKSSNWLRFLSNPLPVHCLLRRVCSP